MAVRSPSTDLTQYSQATVHKLRSSVQEMRRGQTLPKMRPIESRRYLPRRRPQGAKEGSQTRSIQKTGQDQLGRRLRRCSPRSAPTTSTPLPTNKRPSRYTRTSAPWRRDPRRLLPLLHASPARPLPRRRRPQRPPSFLLPLSPIPTLHVPKRHASPVPTPTPHATTAPRRPSTRTRATRSSHSQPDTCAG